MRAPDWRPALQAAHDAALDWLEHLPERPVRPERTYGEMLDALAGPLPEEGEDPGAVIRSLAAAARPGLTAMNHARFFGWVIGGNLPAGVAADWLVTAWDQNTAMGEPTPAMSAVEAVTAGWLLELLDLPRTASVGFVTGAQVANLVCLAAARDRVLAGAGWDVEADGLAGSPPVTVIVGEFAHHTGGAAYPTATTWRGVAAIRISVCNWSIEEPDADLTVEVLAAAHPEVA
jgi:glutamate/tyrosine decarboxylase-like PLP-dependent enzyme